MHLTGMGKKKGWWTVLSWFIWEGQSTAFWTLGTSVWFWFCSAPPQLVYSKNVKELTVYLPLDVTFCCTSLDLMLWVLTFKVLIAQRQCFTACDGASLVMWWVLCQPGVHSKTLSQKTKSLKQTQTKTESEFLFFLLPNVSRRGFVLSLSHYGDKTFCISVKCVVCCGVFRGLFGGSIRGVATHGPSTKQQSSSIGRQPLLLST